MVRELGRGGVTVLEGQGEMVLQQELQGRPLRLGPNDPYSQTSEGSLTPTAVEVRQSQPQVITEPCQAQLRPTRWQVTLAADLSCCMPAGHAAPTLRRMVSQRQKGGAVLVRTLLLPHGPWGPTNPSTPPPPQSFIFSCLHHCY